MQNDKTPPAQSRGQSLEAAELTDEEIEEMTVDFCKFGSDSVSDPIGFARVVVARMLASQPPAPQASAQPAVPEWPEMESLGDLDYAKATPEDWDEDYRNIWQKLQVASRNISILRAYARQLHALAATMPSAAPSGWKLVPIEPTEAMVKAAISRGKHSTKAEYYAAMLAAAPASPQGAGT